MAVPAEEGDRVSGGGHDARYDARPKGSIRPGPAGCFFCMVADVVGVHRAHMSWVVRRISRALVALAPRVIHGIPRGGAAHTTRQAFRDLAGNYYSFTLICGRIQQHS